MWMEHWLHRQGQRRRFFIVWATFAAILAGTQITISLIVAAKIHAHVFHGPPLWVFGLDVLGSAIAAAVKSRSHTGRVTN
jgi:uncharacterized membrane protein YhaH (DUF805 family)